MEACFPIVRVRKMSLLISITYVIDVVDVVDVVTYE